MSDGPTTRRDAWVAAHACVADQLFEVCGSVGAAAGDDRATILLTTLSGRFAWHAELLAALVSLRPGDARADLERRAELAVAETLGVLEERRTPEALCALLCDELVPPLRDAVARERDATDARLEGPRVRALLLVGRDLEDAGHDLAAWRADREDRDAGRDDARDAVRVGDELAARVLALGESPRQEPLTAPVE